MNIKQLTKRWDDLPKWVRVIPYVAISGAITAEIKYLKALQLSDPVVMGVINIVIVLLKGFFDKEIRKKNG